MAGLDGEQKRALTARRLPGESRRSTVKGVGNRKPNVQAVIAETNSEEDSTQH